MKLLLDQNLSFKLVASLKQYYPGSTHVRLIDLDRATDIEIWEYAGKNGFVLVTRDSDFYEHSVLLGSPPKVIWIRSGNTTTVHTRDLLINNKKLINDFAKHKTVGCLELY